MTSIGVREKKAVYLGGAGGAPTNNVIRSLRISGDEYLIGTSSEATDLFLADVDKRYWVLPASSPDYPKQLAALINEVRPSFAHFQNDFEIRVVSRFRRDLEECGVKLLMPTVDVIENCVDKLKSYQIWEGAGIPVPKTMILESAQDLKFAFDTLGQEVWIRAIEGGGGRGALPADNFEFAKLWIDRFKGWGNFTASAMLGTQSVTWLSIWFKGELIVAQTRRRKSWGFGNRTLSGITGVTAVGETCSDDEVTKTALDSIGAIDPQPHGIYGVDLTYDLKGRPNPTEINISRFFTTVYFFTAAGLNMPRIFLDIGLYGKFPSLAKKINPLPDGLLWIRGMDTEPRLLKSEEFEAFLSDQKYRAPQ